MATAAVTSSVSSTNTNVIALAPGTYECQVTVLDANGAKAAFWRAPIAITP